MISLIAAVSNNNVIGKNNDIPWKISDDLKRFKTITSGHHIIMGRKTFESLDSKPLPNRINIIVTNNKNYKSPTSIIICNSLCKAIAKAENDKEIFIIGGGQIYKEALEYADKIYLTKVFVDVDGDTFFPELGKEWHLTEYLGNFSDNSNGTKYCYNTFEKYKL